jgi:hypothetical protein
MKYINSRPSCLLVTVSTVKTRFKRLLVAAGIKNWGQRCGWTEVRLILSSVGKQAGTSTRGCTGIEEVGRLEAFSGADEGVAAAGRAAPGTALTLAVVAACRDPFAVGALVGHF